MQDIISYKKKNTKYFKILNTLPLILFKKIKTLSGKTDSIGIIILSDILSEYSTKNIIEFPFNYVSLEEKFEYTRSQIRDAIVRLEEADLLKRVFDTTSDGHYFTTEISIKLNIANILKLLEDDHSVTSAGLNDCHDNKKDGQIPLKKNHIPSIEISQPSNTFNKKERIRSSSKSNFVKIEKEKLLAKKEKPKELTNKKPKTIFSKILGKLSLIKRPLKEYLPITEETAEKLNHLSGREFSCHFINKLAEKLGNKNAELKFYKEELFLQYMSKVLKNEMRNPYEVNNINFKFKASSQEEREEDKINQYLDEVERSTSMSEEARLRRKIAGIYEGKVAYRMLLGMSVKSSIENKLVISHSSDVRLNEVHRQSDRLLEEIKLIYGNQIQSVDWEVKERSQIHKEYVTAEGIANKKINHEKVNKPNEIVDLGASIEESTTLWGKVKAELIKSYGLPTYISWFSKLEAQENLEDNLLTLKAPTEFIGRWIRTNYEKTIETICQNFSIQVIYI